MEKLSIELKNTHTEIYLSNNFVEKLEKKEIKKDFEKEVKDLIYKYIFLAGGIEK